MATDIKFQKFDTSVSFVVQIKCGMVALPFDLEDDSGGNVERQLNEASAEALAKGCPVKVSVFSDHTVE